MQKKGFSIERKSDFRENGVRKKKNINSVV